MNKQAIVAGSVIVGTLLLIGGGLAAWKYRSIRLAASQGGGFEPAQSVSFLTIGSAKWHPTSALVGTALAIQSVTLSNEVAGRITSVGFESGQVVEAGQVLIKLDDSSEQSDLAAALSSVVVAEATVRSSEAGIRTAQSQLDLAEANMKRWEPAVLARAASAADLDRIKAELDKARADMDVYKAAVDRAKAEVLQSKARADQIRTTIAKKTLLAPFKALAGLRNVHPGQFLAEGASVVGLQGIDSRIYVDFAIPQEYRSRVSPGMRVMATSSAMGTGTKPISIEVVAVDATANATTRNVRIRSVVDNTSGRLSPGMFVDIEVPVADEQTYVVVPSTAVRRAAFGDHVFMIVPGEKPGTFRAKQTFLTLGPSIGSDFVVLKGLSIGDTIAGSGSFKLSQDALVMQDTTHSPAAPGGPGAPGSKPGESPAKDQGPKTDASSTQPEVAASNSR